MGCFFGIVNAQLESLYICVSLDYLMILQDFFVSGLAPSEPTTTTTTMPLEKRPSSAAIKAPPAKRMNSVLLTHVDRMRVSFSASACRRRS